MVNQDRDRMPVRSRSETRTAREVDGRCPGKRLCGEKQGAATWVAARKKVPQCGGRSHPAIHARCFSIFMQKYKDENDY